MARRGKPKFSLEYRLSLQTPDEQIAREMRILNHQYRIQTYLGRFKMKEKKPEFSMRIMNFKKYCKTGGSLDSKWTHYFYCLIFDRRGRKVWNSIPVLTIKEAENEGGKFIDLNSGGKAGEGSYKPMAEEDVTEF